MDDVEVSDWARRVEQMTASSANDQLRAYLNEAHEVLQRFGEAASGHGPMVLEARRTLEAGLERGLSGLREEVASGIGALGERFDATAKRLEDHADTVVKSLETRLASLEQSLSDLRAKIDDAHAFAELSDSVAAQLDRMTGMEERTATRMVTALASAFAKLQDVSGNGHANGSSSAG
jgi:hypothetical protein